MGVHTTESRLPINSLYKFSFVISPFTFKKTKRPKESATHDHLLNCNNIPLFEESTIFTNGNNIFVLEITESLLIKRDRPNLNKNISSAKLFLFDNN